MELPRNTWGELYPEAIRLNSGRSCLEYILKARKYKKVWLPYYTCDAILQPITRNGLDYEFYHIDKDFHIADKINLGKEEVLVYTDYFGLMDDYASEVAYEYSPNVILDNTGLSSHGLVGIQMYSIRAVNISECPMGPICLLMPSLI